MMEMSSGLKTATGLGFFIYLQDRFTRKAAEIGSSAALLEKRMAGSAAGIATSTRLMTGGLMAAAAGFATLKIGDALAAQAAGIDRGVREIRIKGYPAEEAESLRRQALDLGAELGVLPKVAMDAALRTAEYGFSTADEMISALRVTLRAAVATGAEPVVATDTLLTVMRALGYQERDLAMLSGKLQIGADNMRISFQEFASQFPQAIQVMKTYNIGLDEMLAYLIIGKREGMEMNRVMMGLQMSAMNLQAPTAQLRARLAGVAGGEALAAIEAGDFGRALRVLGTEMAKLPAAERVAFLRDIGAQGRSAGVLRGILENAPEVVGLIDELGRGIYREQNAFAEMSEDYDQKLITRQSRLSRIWIALGAAVRKANEPFIDAQNNLIGGLQRFISTNEGAVGAILAPSRSLARVAVTAGLATAGVGALRYGLIKAGIAAAENAGMMRTLGLGFQFALGKMLPVLAVLGGIALAIKGVEWAYRSNWLGFRDWSQRLIGGFGLVSQAVIDSFKYTAQVGGETFAAIPDDLAKKLEAAGLLDTANAWIGRAWNAKSLGVGMAKGLKNALGPGSPFNAEMAREMQLMGGSWASLFGGKSSFGDMSTWYGAGESLGRGFGNVIGALTLVIMKSTNATLLLAQTLKETFGWMRTAGTWGNKYGTEPTKGIARGVGTAASTANWFGWGMASDVLGYLHGIFPQGPYISSWADYAERQFQRGLTPKVEPIMDIGYGAASGMATAAAIRDEIRAGFDRMDRAPRQQGPVQVHTTVEIDKRVLGESVEDIVIDAVRAGAGANV